MSRWYIIFVIIQLLLCFNISAQSILPFSLTGFVEEDSFNDRYNKDQNYTGGGAISLTGDFTESNCLIVPFLRKEVDKLTGVNLLLLKIKGRNPNIIGNSFSFGTSVFTPQNIGTPKVVIGDRPYASLVFVSSKKMRIWQDLANGQDELVVYTELNVGLIGSDLGDTLQTKIHRNKIKNNPNNPHNRPIPQGWSNQISYGGEMTSMYKLAFIKPVTEINWFSSQYKFLQISSNSELNLGYYTNIATGFAIRLGLFNSRIWQNNSNFGGSFNQNPSIRSSSNFFYKNFEIYGFASGRTRLIAYNALLEGQFRKSEYTMRSSEINHLVSEFELGLAVRIWKISFIYEPLAGRTTEINTQLSRTHIWGAYYFSIGFPF